MIMVVHVAYISVIGHLMRRYANASIRRKISRNTCRSDLNYWFAVGPRSTRRSPDASRCVAHRFYGTGGELLSILIDANYRRVRHAVVCRTRARRTACAVRCNGAPRCNDATVLRVNSWENLDNGAYRCRHRRRHRDTFGRFKKDRILIRIG